MRKKLMSLFVDRILMNKWLIFLFACMSITTFSQTCTYCKSYQEDPSIAQYASIKSKDFNWESTECKYWVGRDKNSNIIPITIPWCNPGTLTKRIVDAKDYTKAHGWELLQKQFGQGSAGSTNMYFILYNKYTGILRMFWYSTLSSNESPGLLIATLFPYGNNALSILNTNNSTIKAPDKYLLGSVGTLDTLSYISKYPANEKWAVFEFQLGYDPFISNDYYKRLSFSIQVQSITEQTLTGTLKGTTITEDYNAYLSQGTVAGVSMKGGNLKNVVNGITKYSEKGALHLKNGDEFRKIINNRSSQLAELIRPGLNNGDKVTKYTVKFLDKVSNATNDKDWSKGFEAFNKLLTGFGEIGTVLKFVGNILGFMGEGESGGPSPVAPVISTYNLQLTGRIKQESWINDIVLKVPGTTFDPNSIMNSEFTYYDCPLGIFNVKNTPVVDYVRYDRSVERVAWQVIQGRPPVTIASSTTRKVGFKSCKGRSFDCIVNTSSALELKQLKYALVAEGQLVYQDNFVRHNDYVIGRNGNNVTTVIKPDVNIPSLSTAEEPLVHTFLDPVISDLHAGRLELIAYSPDNKTLTVQTPFVDYNSFEGMTITVPEIARIYIRVVAVFQKKNSSDKTSIFFQRDFEPDFVQGVPINTGYTSNNLDELPPYSNYTQKYMPGNTDLLVNGQILPKAPEALRGRNGIYDMIKFPQGGILANASNEMIVSNTEVGAPKCAKINATSTALITVDCGPTSNVEFVSDKSIVFKSNTIIKKTSKFIARIDKHGYRLPAINPNISFETSVATNCYNNNTYLRTEEVSNIEDLHYTIYPNPVSNGMLYFGAFASAYELLDVTGQTILKGNDAESLSITGLSSGIYILRLESRSEKIIIP